jgi:hypothetical protein
MSIAEEILVALKLDSRQFQEGIDKATEKAKTGGGNIIASLANVGGAVVLTGLAAAAAGVVAIGAAMEHSVHQALDWGNAVKEISEKTGLAAQAASGLALMTEAAGASLEMSETMWLKFARGLESVKGAAGPAGIALAEMGIKSVDMKGKLLPVTTIMQLVADKLNIMDDGLEKDRLLMELFGKTGAETKDILELAANGGVKYFAEQAERLGLSFNSEQLERVRLIGIQWRLLGERFKGIAVQIGNQLLPLIQRILPVLTKVFDSPMVQSAIKSFVGWIGSIVEKIEWLIGDLQYGNIEAGLKNAFGDEVGSAIYKIVNAFKDVYNWLSINIPAAIKTVETFWNTNFVPVITTVKDWIRDNLLPKFKDIYEWLKTSIPEAIKWVDAKWKEFKTTLGTVGDWIRDNLLPKFKDLYDWLTPKMQDAIQWVVDKWNKDFMPAVQGVVTYINGPMHDSISGWQKQMEDDLPGALDTFKTKFYYGTYAQFIEVRNYLNTYVVPIFKDLKNIVVLVTEIAFTPLANFISGTFMVTLGSLQKAIGWAPGGLSELWSGLSGQVAGFNNGPGAAIVAFFNGPFATALSNVHNWLKSIIAALGNIHAPNLGGDGGGGDGGGGDGGGTPAPSWHWLDGYWTTNEYGEPLWVDGSWQWYKRGGKFSAGQPMIVGENGPEAIIPDAGGTVIPNNQLGNLGGNTTINIYGWQGNAVSLAREVDRQMQLRRLLA